MAFGSIILPVQINPFKLVHCKRNKLCFSFKCYNSPFLRKSSQSSTTAHLWCPLGCHRPQSPSRRAALLQNSQRPGISMRRGRCLKANVRFKKIIIHAVLKGQWTFLHPSHFCFPPNPLPLKQTEIVVGTTGCM